MSWKSYSVDEITQVSSKINRTLRRCSKLKKIDLSFNYLRSRLFLLLCGLVQPLEYLNLQDCHLDRVDLTFLNSDSMLKSLRSCKELNLSMNDFSLTHSIVFNIISNCYQLNCLSISHCQIPMNIICQNLVLDILLKDSNQFCKLKYLMIQPFTPPKMHEIMGILHALSLVQSLQKLSFLPALYAFPGSCDTDREIYAFKIIRICGSILHAKGRGDVDFVDF